jgi:hypothetical protein
MPRQVEHLFRTYMGRFNQLIPNEHKRGLLNVCYRRGIIGDPDDDSGGRRYGVAIHESDGEYELEQDMEMFVKRFPVRPDVDIDDYRDSATLIAPRRPLIDIAETYRPNRRLILQHPTNRSAPSKEAKEALKKALMRWPRWTVRDETALQSGTSYAQPRATLKGGVVQELVHAVLLEHPNSCIPRALVAGVLMDLAMAVVKQNSEGPSR